MGDEKKQTLISLVFITGLLILFTPTMISLYQAFFDVSKWHRDINYRIKFLMIYSFPYLVTLCCWILFYFKKYQWSTEVAVTSLISTGVIFSIIFIIGLVYTIIFLKSFLHVL
jgi:hypothetical protein